MTLGLKYKLVTLIFGGARHHLISDAHAERAHVQSTHNWPVCSGYASVPDAYAKHVLKGLRSVHTLVPDAYAQCTHQFLTRMLSARISSWCARSAFAWVPDPHAQPAQKGRSMHVRNSKCSIIFKVPKYLKQRKLKKNLHWHQQQMVTKVSRKKFFLAQTKK